MLSVMDTPPAHAIANAMRRLLVAVIWSVIQSFAPVTPNVMQLPVLVRVHVMMRSALAI